MGPIDQGRARAEMIDALEYMLVHRDPGDSNHDVAVAFVDRAWGRGYRLAVVPPDRWEIAINQQPATDAERAVALDDVKKSDWYRRAHTDTEAGEPR